MAGEEKSVYVEAAEDGYDVVESSGELDAEDVRTHYESREEAERAAEWLAEELGLSSAAWYDTTDGGQHGDEAVD